MPSGGSANSRWRQTAHLAARPGVKTRLPSGRAPCYQVVIACGGQLEVWWMGGREGWLEEGVVVVRGWGGRELPKGGFCGGQGRGRQASKAYNRSLWRRRVEGGEREGRGSV